MKMDKKQKVIVFADKLVEKAKKEKDTRGYRENLGYDSENKLRNYSLFQDLSYVEQCNVITYFYRLCDKI